MTDTKVSIDRVSITGIINEMDILTQHLLKPRYTGFSIGNNGFVEPLGKGKWRIDFNPNMETNTTKNINTFIRKLSNRHMTRLDIAIDIYNDVSFMKYRYIQAGISEKWFSKSKELETIYYGSYKSRRLIRQYDKKKEQLSKGKIIKEEQWGRFEIQLRSSQVEHWQLICENILSNLVLPKYAHLKYNEKAILIALTNGDISWSELSNPSRAKYRKLLYKQSNNTQVSNKFLIPFKKTLPTLKMQIFSYLNL